MRCPHRDITSSGRRRRDVRQGCAIIAGHAGTKHKGAGFFIACIIRILKAISWILRDIKAGLEGGSYAATNSSFITGSDTFICICQCIIFDGGCVRRVITSYSIHYTKLYDNFNVCYTKLLREELASGEMAPDEDEFLEVYEVSFEEAQQYIAEGRIVV